MMKHNYFSSGVILKLLFFILVLSMLSCDGDDSIPQSLQEVSLLDVATNNANTITWIPRQRIKSRNGQTMGFGVYLNPNSDKLFIFLDGGGACFNALTCNFNIDTFTETDFQQRINNEESLILNQESSQNQFRSWNFVFVPYATGDVHVGSNENVNVSNGGPTQQTMVGANNFMVIVEDIKNYFENQSGISEIVIAGASAGGFGLLPNYFKLKESLEEPIPTTVLVDSGPIFYDNTILTPCLVDLWESNWNISNILPNDLNTFTLDNYEQDIQKIYEYASRKYPEDNFGLLSYYEDSTNMLYYSFGKDQCSYPPLTAISEETYKNALIDLKVNVLDNYENWRVFYKNGDSHVFLGDANLDQQIENKTLNDWILDLRSGTAIDLVD